MDRINDPIRSCERDQQSHGPVETLVALRVEILHLGESLLQLVLCLNQSLSAFLTLSALKQWV